MDKQVRYLPDLTAKNLNNKVEKESHHLKRQIKNRIIVPIYGCFYKEKLIVNDVFNKKFLKHGKDYFLGGYRPQYSKYADGEVYSFIVINNDKVSESIEISYQAYGVAAADNSVVTAKLLEDNFSTYDIVPYNKLKNLPIDFTPSLHYHDIGDIKEFQLLLFYLDQIRFCILADNKELYAYLAKIELSIEAIMERALNNYDDLVYQKIKKYYEDFSLAMFGLDKVKNYPLMNFEDGFTIGDSSHAKMFSDLGEKYFSLKALEGLSKGIYSTLVNIEKTHLGYFKETTVVPSVEFLESLVIGASITIPRLDSIEITEEIKKLYPDLEVKDCRYLVKKVSNRVGNKNSCYVYIHRDSGRTYVMVGYMQDNEYKTKFYKIASSLDGEVIINNINKHILDYDNPHLDDKRDVDLSKVENLPIATKEDIICNLPVRKYITLRNLLLFMKRFKTGTKNVTEIYEQLTPRNEARLMQTIFSACGSWKNIDPNKIELCRVIQKEEDPWIYISESTTQMWEGDEVLIFTISCSDHYVNKTFVYKLVLDSTTIFTDALTIPLAQAIDENFSQEFERWTREVSIPDSEGMTQEELIYKTFVKTFITLSSNSTQVIFRTNFRQNPVFRGIELYENGSEVPEIVPVKKDPVKVKFNLYNFDEASDSIKDLIANSNHVTIKPDPSALEILINKQDGGLLACFFKIITDNFSTDWMSGNEFDWHLSQGRFKFLPTDPLDESGELFLENGLFVNLANFRDDDSGAKQTNKIKIEIRAGWVYNGTWEEEGSINYGTLPLKIKVRSTTGGYKNMDLLTTIQELNRTTPVVVVGEQEPMTLNASNVNENTMAICRVEYDMQTRLIEIINYSDQTTSSTTTTSTTTTTNEPTTSTTTTTTLKPFIHREIEFAFIGYQPLVDEFRKTGVDDLVGPFYSTEKISYVMARAAVRAGRVHTSLPIHNVLRPRVLSGGWLEEIKSITVKFYAFDNSWRPGHREWATTVKDNNGNWVESFINCNVNNAYYKNWVSSKVELTGNDVFVNFSVEDVILNSNPNIICKKIIFTPDKPIYYNPDWNKIEVETFETSFDWHRIDPSTNLGPDHWIPNRKMFVEILVNDYWVFINCLELGASWVYEGLNISHLNGTIRTYKFYENGYFIHSHGLLPPN